MAVNIHEYIPNVTERPRVTITSDKFKQEFYVEPMVGGYVFYQIRTSTGPLPEELRGRYTRMKYAVDAVVSYERRAKPSKAVERDMKAERRDAAKVQRDSNEHVRERADNREESVNLS